MSLNSEKDLDPRTENNTVMCFIEVVFLIISNFVFFGLEWIHMALNARMTLTTTHMKS